MKTKPDNNPLDRLPPILRKDLDKNLCVCMDVPRLDIINAIINGATTLEQVKQQTYATMGSGCCVTQIERLIECLCKPEPKRRAKSRRNKPL